MAAKVLGENVNVECWNMDLYITGTIPHPFAHMEKRLWGLTGDVKCEGQTVWLLISRCTLVSWEEMRQHVKPSLQEITITKGYTFILTSFTSPPRFGCPNIALTHHIHWRRKWQPTPVFLPGESQGWRSLVGCRLWGQTELDTTEET